MWHALRGKERGGLPHALRSSDRATLGQNADRTLDVLWEVCGKKSGNSGQKPGNDQWVGDTLSRDANWTPINYSPRTRTSTDGTKIRSAAITPGGIAENRIQLVMVFCSDS